MVTQQTRESAAIELVNAYQCKCAASALHLAAGDLLDACVSECNDIFYAAASCEAYQLQQFDSAIRRFNLAMVTYTSIVKDANPVNWLSLAFQIKRQAENRANSALEAYYALV
jgi:hypothetical protein